MHTEVGSTALNSILYKKIITCIRNDRWDQHRPTLGWVLGETVKPPAAFWLCFSASGQRSRNLWYVKKQAQLVLCTKISRYSLLQSKSG